MQLTQVLLHFYTYFPVLLFKAANIYIGYNKIFGKRGHLGWRNLYKGLNSPPFSCKNYFSYHLKRFRGTKRLGKHIWYKLKRFRGTKLPCKHTRYRPKRFRGTKWTTENGSQKWTSRVNSFQGKTPIGVNQNQEMTTLCGAQIIDHEIDIYFQSSHNSYSEEG